MMRSRERGSDCNRILLVTNVVPSLSLPSFLLPSFASKVTRKKKEEKDDALFTIVVVRLFFAHYIIRTPAKLES